MDRSYVNMKVNLIEFTVIWYVNDIFQAKALINPEMVKMPLFLFVEMYYSGMKYPSWSINFE